MRLAWPDLEKSLRQRVRREVRGSPDLLRERKAHRRPPKSWGLGWLFRLILPFAALGLALVGKGSVELMCLALSLYATGTACLRSIDLLRGLWDSQDLRVLSHLPVPDEDLFRLQWGKFLRGSLWILWTCAVFCGGLALERRLGTGRIVVAAALGAAQWLVVAGTAAALAAWKPQGPWRAMGFLFNAGALGCWIGGKLLLPLVKAAPGAYLLAIPGGWAMFAFQQGILGPITPAAFAAAVPAILGGILLTWAKDRLREGYRPSDIAVRPPSGEMILEHLIDRDMARRQEYDPELVENPWKAPGVREDVRRSIPSWMEDRIRERGFADPAERSRAGFLDRIFGRLLSRREKAVADLLIGGPSGLTMRWKLSAALAALGMGALFLHPLAGFALGGILALTLVGGGWPAFQPTACAGKFMPLLAAYPVGYFEVSRVFVKFNALRVLAWAPMGVAFAATAGHTTGFGAAAGAWIGLRVVFLALMLPFVAALGHHSSGTNDTDPLTFRGCFGLLIPAAFFTSVGLLSAFALFIPLPSLWMAGAAGFAASAVGFWGFYGFIYNRGRIDLIRSVPLKK